MMSNGYDAEAFGFDVYEGQNYAYKRRIDAYTTIIVTNATPTDDWGFTIWNGCINTHGEANPEWAAACACRAALSWCGYL